MERAVQLTIRVDEDLGADLYRWLVEDSEAGGEATIAPAGVAGSGDMGVGFDLLNLLVPNAISLASVIVSIASFRESRRRGTGAAPSVQVEHAGVFVLVEGDGTDAVRELRAGADTVSADTVSADTVSADTVSQPPTGRGGAAR